MSGAQGDAFHVRHGGADILGGDVAPAEALDRPPEGVEQRFAVEFALRPAQHGLATAERQAGQRVLVAHALGQPDAVLGRFGEARIRPQPAPATGRTEPGGLNDDGARQPRLAVFERHDLAGQRGSGGAVVLHVSHSNDWQRERCHRGRGISGLFPPL